MTIHEVRTSCECTLVDQTFRRGLAPGESTILRIGVTPPERGETHQQVVISLKGADQSEVVLPIVLKGAPLHPPFFSWDPPEEVALLADSAALLPETAFQVLAVELPEQPCWVSSATASSPRIEGTVQLTSERLAVDGSTATRTYEIRIRALDQPETSAGEHALVRLTHVEGEREETLRDIRVKYRIESPMLVSPTMLIFDRSAPADSQRCKTILVTDTRPLPHDEWEWSTAQPLPAWLSLEDDPSASGASGRRKIKVNVSDEWMSESREGAGPLMESITLDTSHPLLPQIRFRVRVEPK